MDRQDLIDAISDRLEDRQDCDATMRKCATIAADLLVELGLLLPDFSPPPTPYRVSIMPNGGKLWWCVGDIIPPTHTGIRYATPEEAAIMDKIVHSRGAPSLALGEKIQRLLRDAPP